MQGMHTDNINKIKNFRFVLSHPINPIHLWLIILIFAVPVSLRDESLLFLSLWQ